MQTRSHNLVNEIDTDDNHANAPGASIAASTGDNWIDPVYDAAGNMIFGPQPGYEATAAMAQHYVYDAWNRMTAVKPDGDVVERYMYDPYGKVTVLNGEDDRDGAVTEWDEDSQGISDWKNEILYCGYRRAG